MTRPSEAGLLRVSAATHPGHARTKNEDSIGVTGWSGSGQIELALHAFSGEGPVVCTVADGVGGQPAGDVASALVVECLVHRPAPADTEELSDSLLAIHEELLSRASTVAELAGMASTVAVLTITADAVLCANIGDTRVYELQQSELMRLSFDDNPDIAGADPSLLARTLTQALGGTTREPPDPHPQWFAREENLAFLLCSDGLTTVVKDDEILATVQGSVSDENSVTNLLSLALDRGAPDNVSVMVVRLG